MKLWNLPITVVLKNGNPKQLEYKNRKRSVERILDTWRSCEGWWQGQAAREYWKLELENDAVIEVYLEDIESGQWVLARSFD